MSSMPSPAPPSTPVVVQEEVAAALAEGRGVVALESTILAHGLPHPDNIEIAGADRGRRARGRRGAGDDRGARRRRARRASAASELEQVCTAPDIAKLSMRDLGVAVALGLDGATTVASTSAVAHLAGIRVFATGGLGGVHRGRVGDLRRVGRPRRHRLDAGARRVRRREVDPRRAGHARVPRDAVGAGARLPDDAFPGFYLSDSGHEVPWRVESAAEAAAVVVARDRLPTDAAGVVLANPLPADRQVDRGLHDRLVAEGLAVLEREGVHGKDVTPRLLEYFHENSGRRVAARQRRARAVERTPGR